VRKISTKLEKLEQAIKNARTKADAAVKTLKDLEDKKKVLMATEIGDVLRDFSIKPQDLRTLLESIKNGGEVAPVVNSADATNTGAAGEEDDYIPEPIIFEGVDVNPQKIICISTVFSGTDVAMQTYIRLMCYKPNSTWH